MDNKIVEIVKTWFYKAEDWQKDTFINLWKGSDYDSITERAYKLALKEHRIVTSNLSSDTTFPKDINFINTVNTNTALIEISDVKGVCALAPTKSLKFGLGLNIVYGENGCGKSSYVRILKKAQDPKSSINIYGNVYSKEERVKPSANLIFDYDGNKEKNLWSLTNQKSYPIRIYDTQIAKHFVEEKNNVIYEPKLLQVFSDVARVIEYVNGKANNEILTQKSLLISPPESITDCSLTKEYSKLKNVNEIESFEKSISFSSKDEEELESIKIALSDNDPKGTIRQLSAKKTYLKTVFENFKEYSIKLDDSFIEKYITYRKNQIETKAVYDEFIKESRGISIFKGLGSDEWVDLWKSAAKYLEYISSIDEENKNKSKNYCVLCQQELSNEAHDKIKVLNKFYESTLKTDFENADKKYKGLVQTISELIERLNKTELKVSLESNAIPNEISNKILDFFDCLYSRAKWIYNYDDTIKNAPKNIDIETMNDFFNGVCKNIDTKITLLDELVENYDIQYNKYLELTAKKWFFDNKSNFKLKEKIFTLNSLFSKSKTNMVTTLKKDLSQIMITKTYVDRFKNELNKISSNHSIKVELKQGATKGKVYHKIALVGAVENRNAEDILSEGEYRAVSIAAFLADLSSWNINQAFVFDDPINSLDQNFEEKIAERLVLLASERQVIIFTHRLAFAEMLNRLAHDRNKAAKGKGYGKTAVNYIKLARNPLGDPDYQNDFANYKLDAQLNGLSETIAQIENSQNQGNHQIAKMLLKGLCSTLRDIIEKSIESTLLCNIVSRYARNVSTEKIRYLKAITDKDVDFINHMMSKYSNFDHSHSIERPVQLPPTDEVKNDIKDIREWYKDFKSRLKKYD